MRIPIQKWGNSLAIRIPKTIALESKIGQGSAVDLRLVKGKVVLAPIKKRYTLVGLLAQVTKENLHSEVTTGGPVGREAW